MDVQITYRVTRLPGAPPRRGARAWEPGETLIDGLTADQVAAIAADPGYRIEPVTPERGHAPRRAKGLG